MCSQKYRAVIIVYVNLFVELYSRYSLITCKTSNAVLDKALDHSQNITMQGLTTKEVVKDKYKQAITKLTCYVQGDKNTER